MRARRFPYLLAAALVGAALATPALAAPPGELVPGAHPSAAVVASGRVVYHYDRGASAARAARPTRGGSTPDMTYHGGPVLTGNTSAGAVFWGPKWADANFVGDKIVGLDSWYRGVSGSNYAQTTTEYVNSAGVHVSPLIAYTGSKPDYSTASGGGSTSAILAEVARVYPNPVANGYYPVYTDLPRGRANYCAWHSSGTINNTPVEIAFFWSLDGDPGCDAQDNSTGHSQGLAALANVTGHELAEAMTDPTSPGAWYDGQGAENGDKCAWTFNVPSVAFPNGTSWKIQGEWSNIAYDSGKGYPNSSGQTGCLTGA